MRTKIALLSAALVAAGVASSMAQSNVYSLNVVGYVNIPVSIGYNLISCPLQSPDVTSSINSALTNATPVVPANSEVYTWDTVHGHFAPAVYAGGDGNWYDVDGNAVSNAVPPGAGFFFHLKTLAQQVADGNASGVSNVTLTVVGTVLQGTNKYPVTAGFNFYGNFEPVVSDLTTNGWNVHDNDEFYTFAGGHYSPVEYGVSAASNDGTNSLFTDVDGNTLPAAPGVGAGFLYRNLGTSNAWTQVFTVH